MTELPQVLRTLDPREMVTLADVAFIAGKTVETARNWVANEYLGWKVAGQWRAHLPAVLMFLRGDRKALRAFHDGDTTSGLVKPYYTEAADLKATTLRKGGQS